MKYKKDRVEAVKILFLQILELNEKLETEDGEKEIQLELNGGKFPSITVRFWDWESKQKPIETFEMALDTYHERNERKHDFSALSAKVKEWGELVGNSEKEG